MSFNNQPITITDAARFSQFSSDLMLTPLASFKLNGFAAPSAETALGRLSLTGIPAADTIKLQGFNSFMAVDGSNIPLIKVDGIDILSATTKAMVVQTAVTITNPSESVHILNIGDLTLDIYFGGVALVRTIMTKFKLPLGSTHYVSQGVFVAPIGASSIHGRQFMSNIVNGIDSHVQLTGRLVGKDGTVKSGTNVPYLNAAILGFAPITIVPGLEPERQMLRGTQLVVPLYKIPQIAIVQKIPTRVQLYNPFTADVFIISSDIGIYRNVDKTGYIGQWKDTYSSPEDYMRVPGKTTIETKQFSVSTKFNLAEIQTLMELLNQEGASLTMSGTLEVLIGGIQGQGFTQVVDFYATDVPSIRVDV